MSTLAEAAVALRKAAADMPKATAAGVAEATALLAAAVLVGQARAGAGSGRLRGVGKSGAAIGVKGTVLHGTGLVRATGPAWLLDHPTKAHGHHPGTKGKPYFEEAVAEMAPKVRAIIERNIAERALRGL